MTSSVPSKRAFDQTKNGASTSDISTSSAPKKAATSATAANVTAPRFPTIQQPPRKTFTVDASTSKDSIANATKVAEKKADVSESLKKAVEIATVQTIDLEFADLKARQESFIAYSKKTIAEKKETYSREKTACSLELSNIENTIKEKTAFVQDFEITGTANRNHLESLRQEARKAAAYMAEIQEKLDIATKRFNEANVAKNIAESDYAKSDLAADQAKSVIDSQQEQRLKIEEKMRVLQQDFESSVSSISEKIQALGGTLD
jgi:hypothetical protein